MMGLNLHNVVRAAITSIHPDEACILYRSIGQKNVKGVVTPVYDEPVNIEANFQPDTDKLEHPDGKNVTSDSMVVYLYSIPQNTIMGGQRIPTRTGDILKRDNEYWLVTSIEDWSQDGWCKVTVNRQINEPNFTASEWWENANSGQ